MNTASCSEPCVTRDKAPLTLVTGADRRMLVMARLVAVLACIGLGFGGGAMPARFTAVFALLCAWLWLERDMEAGCGQLRLFPGGRCRTGAENDVLVRHAWCSRWYIVLSCAAAGRKHRIVISAARQDPDEYRKLLCWARLGRWEIPI